MNLSYLKNIDIAYLIGAFQADGYFYIFNYEKRNKIYNRFGIYGKEISLPMIESFRDIFNSNFKRKVTINFNRKRKGYMFRTSINRIKSIFYNLDILPKQFHAPNWIIGNNKLFGSYLAGLIDGDGSICIKRPKYPQCSVKITNGSKPIKLSEQTENILNCKTSIEEVHSHSFLNGREIFGKGYNLRFYISKNNINFVKNHVYPRIKIKHKTEILDRFFEIKKELITTNLSQK